MANDRFQMTLLLVLLLGLSQPPGAFGQAQYTFRFHADVGTRVHTISRSEISMSVMHGNDSGLDTVTVEAERMESLTNRIEASTDGRFSALLVYDSVRARMRPVGGRWQDIAPTERELARSRVVLTDRFEALEAEFVDVPHLNASVAEVMRGVGGGVHLELPEKPVSVGESWGVDLVYPLTFISALGRDEGVSVSGGLESTATARLDSVVFRSSDTLAYITVLGRFVPKSADGLVSMSGSLASTLVWSSGWHAYASAATRAVVVVQIQRDPNEPTTTSRLRFDITTQTRVRP